MLPPEFQSDLRHCGKNGRTPLWLYRGTVTNTFRRLCSASVILARRYKCRHLFTYLLRATRHCECLPVQLGETEAVLAVDLRRGRVGRGGHVQLPAVT